MAFVKITTTYPGIDLGGYGVVPPYFASGAEYEVENIEPLKNAIAQLKIHYPEVASKLTVEIREPVVAAPVAAAIANPAPPPAPVVEEEVTTMLGEPEVEPVVEEPLVLTEEDLELVEYEIEKLLSKETIAEREPILIATGNNSDLPKELRIAYLEGAIAHAELQKGLKDTARKILEQL